MGCWGGVLRYADIADIDLGIGSMARLLNESIICSLKSDIGVAEQEATLSQ
jgi:hypothetical protein